MEDEPVRTRGRDLESLQYPLPTLQKYGCRVYTTMGSVGKGVLDPKSDAGKQLESKTKQESDHEVAENVMFCQVRKKDSCSAASRSCPQDRDRI